MNADAEDTAMDPDSDQDQDDKETNPLAVPLNEDDQPTQEQIMEQWFSQDVFAAAAEDGVLEASDSDDEKTVLPNISKKAEDRMLRSKDSSPTQSQKVKLEEDFEIVPEGRMDASDDSSSDEDSEEEDDNTKAEILAYAKKMLRKKQREQILAYANNVL